MSQEQNRKKTRLSSVQLTAAEGIKSGQGHTFLAERGVAAPGEVPLAGEGVAANNIVARVTLVGDLGLPNQLGVRSGLPAILDLWQVRAGLIP